MVKQLLDSSAKIQKIIIGFLMIVLSIVVFVQVVARKISPVPIPWTEEVARLSMIWLTYLGLAATFHLNVHIRVDLIDGLLKTENAKRWSEKVNHLLGLLFSYFLTYLSLTYLIEQLEFGQTTSTLSIPMWIVILPVFIGSVSSLAHFVLKLFVAGGAERT